MARRINAIFNTGCAGNGKTEYMGIEETLFAPKNNNGIVGKMDMSKIFFDWGITQPGNIGDEIKYYAHLASEGKYLPDETTIRTFKAWLEDILGRYPNLELLIFAGVPRTTAQLEVLEFFKHSLVTCIHATREQSDASVLRRLNKIAAKGGKPRIDDVGGKPVLDERWQENETLTLPMMGTLGDKGLHLDRNDPMNKRIMETLYRLDEMRVQGISPVSERLLGNAFNYMQSPNHPVHAKIVELDGIQAPLQPRKLSANRGIRSMVLTSKSVLAAA